MKKFIRLFSLVTIILFTSCNSEEVNNDLAYPLTNQEISKIDEVKQLFIEYGWEVSENPTREEIDEALNADLDSLRNFLEKFKAESNTINLTFDFGEGRSRSDISERFRNLPDGLNYRACEIRGAHHSTVASSTTYMLINYNYLSTTIVVCSGAEIDPKAKWTQGKNQHYEYKNGGKCCEVVVDGTVKHILGTTSMRMIGNIDFDINKGRAIDGEVIHFS